MKSVKVETEKGSLAIKIMDPIYGIVTIMSGNDFPYKYLEMEFIGCSEIQDYAQIEWRYPKVGEYVMVRSFSRTKTFISSKVVKIQELN